MSQHVKSPGSLVTKIVLTEAEQKEYDLSREKTRARIAEHKAKQILYIRPKNDVSEIPVDDELVEIMEKAYSKGTAGSKMRGFHTCVCGENSRNYNTFLPGRYVTNSLCVHYLRWHRDEVPEEELEKVWALEGE